MVVGVVTALTRLPTLSLHVSCTTFKYQTINMRQGLIENACYLVFRL
jgi:hypothetical protein